MWRAAKIHAEGNSDATRHEVWFMRLQHRNTVTSKLTQTPVGKLEDATTMRHIVILFAYLTLAG